MTTGVLAADATTRVQLARRRRWLVGGGVLGLVVVLAYVLVTTLQADQARDAARAQAVTDEAEVGFARVVVDRAESYETPAATVVVDVRSLRAALQEHLTATERTSGELSQLVAGTTTSLRSTADAITELTDRELPPLDGLVDEADRDAVLTELDRLRVEADALVAEVHAAALAAEEWSAAVMAVDEALAAHVEVVESKTGDGSPPSLADGWRAEVAPLERLLAAATDAEQVAGLARWAGAHRAYAQGTLDFVDQAVQLLEDGDTEGYNQLFETTFDDDPFDLVAEARAGAEEALGGGPLVELATVDARARIVRDQLTTVETTVASMLGGDG